MGKQQAMIRVNDENSFYFSLLFYRLASDFCSKFIFGIYFYFRNRKMKLYFQMNLYFKPIPKNR